MSTVDIDYGQLLTIDIFDGTDVTAAAQKAVAFATKDGAANYEPLVAISAETFYFSKNLSVGGNLDIGSINFNELDVSGDATLDASLNVKGNSYLRGKLEVNEICALEKATAGGVDTFRLANIDNISDISYALQQMKTGETAINSGNNISLKIGGDDMLSINAAGNVGIRTTTPSKSLEVVGDISCQNLYASKRVIETRTVDINNFEVGDRMFHSGDNKAADGGWTGSDQVKYIPLAKMNNSNSMTVKGILRNSGGTNVSFMDLLFSARYYNAMNNGMDALHVQGTITGKVDDNCKLVLFQRVHDDGDEVNYGDVKYWLYLVTTVDFTLYNFNITGTNVEYVWPGPTDMGLDEHPMDNQFASFPRSREVDTELGTGPHSLDLSFNSGSGIRTMYTSTNFHERIAAHIFIDVIYHEKDDSIDASIIKFPGDVSCVDLYSNKILTPSGNNKLYIVPNPSDTNDHRIIHLGLMGGDEPIVGQLRFGRADPYGTNPWARHHSIKVQADHAVDSNNYMRFDLHNGADGASGLGETYAEQVNVMTLRGDGNVGIGTITPSEKLHVSGNFRVDGDVHLGIMSTLEAEGEVRLGGPQATGRWHSIACYNSATEANNYMAFRLHAGNGHDSYNETANEILRLDGDGNVGIGTTAPSTTLEVVGDISCQALYSNKLLTASGNNTLYITPNHLEIGATDPGDGSEIQYHSIKVESAFDVAYQVLLDAHVATEEWVTTTEAEETRVNGVYAGMTAGRDATAAELAAKDDYYNNVKTPAVAAANTARTEEATAAAELAAAAAELAAATVHSYMHFDLHNGGQVETSAQVNVMTLRGDGNVGIGTPDPSETLEVVGDISCHDLKFQYNSFTTTLASVVSLYETEINALKLRVDTLEIS